MQIVVTCDSYEELIAAAKQILEGRIAEGSPRKADPEQDAKPAPKKEKAPAKKDAPAKAAETEEQPLPFKPAEEPAADKAVDESDVKVLLAEKIKSGKKAEVRELFAEYGVAKLSELMTKCPDKLAELAKKAEAL